MGPPETGRLVSGETFQNIPYNQRWDYLKDIIVDAFLGRNPPSPALKFKELSEFMERNYAFSALPEDYRYRFRKWNIRKNTKKREKEAMIKAIGKRKHPEGSVSFMEIQQGYSMRPVDGKQLERYLKDSIRSHTPSPLGPGIFSRWNLPYTAYRASLTRKADYPPTFVYGPAMPEYLSVNSPEASSAGQGPVITPTFAMIQQKTLLDRSTLLLQGRREELLSMCHVGDRRIICDWLHDYWMYCFVTAKFWGVGPQEWTAGLMSQLSLSSTTFGTAHSFHSPFASSQATPAQDRTADESARPTELCFSAIHLTDEEIYGPSFRLHEPSSWSPWPDAEMRNRSHQTCMQDAFNHKRFSTIAPGEVMISQSSIVDAISNSPKDLTPDSWAFAIMSGNRELITKLYLEMAQEEMKNQKVQNRIDEIHPYHLAASFLDGGRTCCHIMSDLIRVLHLYHPIALNNQDSKGHTVLDTLIISVLRSHTDITPAEVSISLAQSFSFPGEEKDICGRWDAESPEMRQLHKAGKHRIPENWKHNFCHSSVQAVCHSAIAIFMAPSRPDINTMSGLFRRRCRGVGCALNREMELGPLHIVVVVAFHLAENGKYGETMFGAVALLVCMLVLGADPTISAEMSVVDLFASAEQKTCTHRSITAMELAEQVPQAVIDGWKPSCRLGWRCLSLILRRVTGLPHNQQFSNKFSNGMKLKAQRHTVKKCSIHQDHTCLKMPCSGESLGLLWATIQTELVIHRNAYQGHPEVSYKFDFVALLRWLEGKTPTFETPLVEDGWMNNHTSCGWFRKRHRHWSTKGLGVTVTDVLAKGFSHTTTWKRVHFVDEPHYF